MTQQHSPSLYTPSPSVRKPDLEGSRPARLGELFLVATPIGNLKDITLRALEVLQSVACIAAEDTRTSGVLLQHYGITTPLVACHEHNEAQTADRLVARMQMGESIALICDAGTPLLSDPGARLVGAAIAAGLRVTPLPGASALLAALSMAGLPALPFYFAGFVPPKSIARREALARLRSIPATLVVYESPHRLIDLLADAQAMLGDRQAAVAREITKLYEECQRGPLSALAAHYTEYAPRGECVVLVAPPLPEAPPEEAAVDRLLCELLRLHRVKDAAAIAAAQTGLPKRDLYARALQLQQE